MTEPAYDHARALLSAATASTRALQTTAAVGWIWAAALLATREHDVATYQVLAAAPPAWGMVILPLSTAAGIVAVGTAVVSAGRRRAPLLWLLPAWFIPSADLLRLYGCSIPYTFLEPIFLAAVTGESVRRASLCRAESSVERRPIVMLRWTFAFSLAAALWWYVEASTSYHRFLLGHIDFGQHAVRVASTWEGWGFLKETPGFPAFWDHFNPGLALLAPLWGLWPDPRLFLAIQAVCLAAPAPLIWGIARRFGAPPGESTLWSLAYLLFPAVGQLNVNYSYGWHAVSLALPLIFAAIYWACCRRYTAAIAAIVLACSFKETVPVVIFFAAVALGIQSWLWQRRRPDRSTEHTGMPLLNTPPPWSWFALGLFLLISAMTISHVAPFTRFQMNKFAHLGDATTDIMLALFRKPSVFWGTLFQARCGYYLLALLVPWGVATWRRGWVVRASLLVPVLVLMLMDLPASTSIAFQYSTTLIPVLTLAAVMGAHARPTMPDRDASDSNGAHRASSRSPSRHQSGSIALSAVVTSFVAGTFFGAMPWSAPTRSLMEFRTYHNGDTLASDQRAPGSRGHGLITETVRLIRSGRRTTSVLATGRIAAHLIGVRRLETVSLALDPRRRREIEREAGPDRAPIELFEWVLLDRLEAFQQSPEETMRIARQALRAGYRVVKDEEGLLFLHRPDERAPSHRPK